MLAAEQVQQGMAVHLGFMRGGVHSLALRGTGVELHELGEFHGRALRFVWRLRQLMAEIGPGIVQTWLPAMDVIGGPIAISLGLPWLLSERSSAEAYKGGLIYRARARIAPLASAIVANSGAGLKYWDGLGRPRIPKFVIPNAVPLDELEKVSPYTSQAVTSPYILVVGRLAPEKDVATALRAAISLEPAAPVQFVVVGEGSERGNLERLAAKAPVPGRIVFLPYSEHWWGLLGCAAALISVSRYEGNPNAVLEAAAAGCPLILSDIAAHREVFDLEQALFVPIGDAAHLAGAIRQVLGDRTAALARAERARASVSQRKIRDIAQAYEVVYRSIAR